VARFVGMTRWFTVREAADYLRISEGLIREAVKLGYLEAYTFGSGKELRLTDEHLDTWMMSRPWEPRRIGLD
jgi:excisionase family DNA binding protein